MSINWKYNPNDYNPDRFQLVPPGKYRVRIEEAEEQTSRSGYPMIKMTLKVSGYNSHIWHYMVFMNTDADKIRLTNDNLGRIFDSFNIAQGDLNLKDWKGKVGAAEIKNELDNRSTMRAVVSYFITRSEQEKLPAWQEYTAAKPAHGGVINPEPFDPSEEVPF